MSEEKKTWFDNGKNIDKLAWCTYAVAIILVLWDALEFVHLYHKHGHFDIENIFGFYGIYGAVAYAFIVLAGTLFRKVIKREENYYD